MKVNVFDAKTSSFAKNETITDTIKMLCGYSIGQSIFVIRSKIEGVCRWLEESITEYTAERGFPRASFLNAGDGRHEHPSQEMLDEFSFLEQTGWQGGAVPQSIHLVLLGDLFHGRTVHSKADGLRIYDRVFVDLIAPAELAMPKTYEDRMRANGFVVRKFASIEEYLKQAKVAKIWYFTRLQLERMGEKVLSQAANLRKAVTMQREYVDKLPAGTKFFHPLPRDARYPTLPFWLDGMALNGWDQQSQNGYFTRIILLGMVGGLLGGDFEGAQASRQPSSPLMVNRSPKETNQLTGGEGERSPLQGGSAISDASDFIKEIAVPPDFLDSDSAEVGLVPLENGIIIENLAEGQIVEKIWAMMYMVRSILGLTGVGGQGVSGSAETASGFISVPDMNIDSWDRQPLKKLAAMAPGSLLRVVRKHRIIKEFRLQVPPRIYNFPDISCKNTACVSHASNMQHEVPAYFLRVEQENESPKLSDTFAFSCKYCEMLHSFWQIWDYKYSEALEAVI